MIFSESEKVERLIWICVTLIAIVLISGCSIIFVNAQNNERLQKVAELEALSTGRVETGK